MFFDTMDRFNGVTLAVLGSRYGGNQCLLVTDLVSAGLLESAPMCSRCSVTMVLYPSTLHTNILESVCPGVTVQTDGWAAYQGLKSVQHDSVNHSESWVVHTGSKKITTNTVEGTHSSLRRMSRKMNLFYGCPSEMLQKKSGRGRFQVQSQK